MTSPASTPVPHSRWLVRENVNRLAASHAKAAEAISALQTAAVIHGDRGSTVRTFRQRMAMRRDWPQVIWFWVALLGTTLFLGWVSARLVARLAPVPVFAAVLPGVLLAVAAGGAARFAAYSVKRRGDVGPAGIALSLIPFTAASCGVAAWVSLWLVMTSGTPTLAAVVFALCLTLAVAVALMTCSHLGGQPTGGTPADDDTVPLTDAAPVVRRPPRRLRARHKRARSRLDEHARHWTAAAHRYAVTVPSTGHPENVLASLLSDDMERLPMDGLDPFDAMILCGLRDYHPAALAADLSAASAKLAAAVNN